MLTLEQNIRAVIEACFPQTKEVFIDLATQRIVELAESNAPNTLEDDENRWKLPDEVVPPDGEWVIISVCDDSGDNAFRYTTAGWHYKDAWFIEGDSEPVRTMVTAWKRLPKPYRGI